MLTFKELETKIHYTYPLKRTIFDLLINDIIPDDKPNYQIDYYGNYIRFNLNQFDSFEKLEDYVFGCFISTANNKNTRKFLQKEINVKEVFDFFDEKALYINHILHNNTNEFVEKIVNDIRKLNGCILNNITSYECVKVNKLPSNKFIFLSDPEFTGVFAIKEGVEDLFGAKVMCPENIVVVEICD